MTKFILSKKIIALSKSTNWDCAKLEWGLDEIYEADEPETCLCGHYPIIELCIIRNRENGNCTTVGNVCVKKFLGLTSDKIFGSVKKVRKDNKKALNAEAIEYGYSKKWINEWEKNFCLSTMRKRNLSIKQLDIRKQINEKFSNNLKRSVSGAI